MEHDTCPRCANESSVVPCWLRGYRFWWLNCEACGYAELYKRYD